MAGQEVELIYVNRLVPETEIQVGHDEDGQLVVYGVDGSELMEAQVLQENSEEVYLEEQPMSEPQYLDHNNGSIVLDSGEFPEGLEILESTDSVGGDMRFVMVNQQEVFVVKNSSQSKKPLPYKKEGRVMKARRRVTPQSVKKGPKLIQDFLLPHLDNRTFGNRLVWTDRSNGRFAMSWCHKNGADWKADDCAVFREWDLLKERKIQDVPQYWMEAKQRFRAALAKVSTTCKTDSEDYKTSRIFQIKWTRETRPEILNQIYTSSKYFELPPPNSMGASTSSAHQTEEAQYLLDQEFTQEEVVVSPGETISVDGEMPVEVVEMEVIQEEEAQYFETDPSRQAEGEVVIESDSAQLAAADVLSSRFFTARQSSRYTVRRESLKPAEKCLRRARRAFSKIYTQCPMCPMYFTSNYSIFLRHLMIHRGERAYTCLHCTASFKLPDLFIFHLQSHHNAPPHICFLANIESTSRTDLRRAEFRLVHQNLKTCGVCAEHCKTQHDLIAHVKELHGIAQLREVRNCALKPNRAVRMRQRFNRISSPPSSSAAKKLKKKPKKKRRKLNNDHKETSLVVCDGKVLIEECPIEWTGENVFIN